MSANTINQFIRFIVEQMMDQQIDVAAQHLNLLMIFFEEYRELDLKLQNPYSLVSILSFQYCCTLYLTLLNPYSNTRIQITRILWIPLHILYVMLFWSTYKSIVTDPGRVPKNYGMFFEDQEIKKKKYCLRCRQFKPQRCYHCERCKRCVVNMDFHSFWYGNCIGFFNRKFHILGQFYFSLSTTLSLVIASLQTIDILFKDQEPQIQSKSIIPILILSFYLFVVFISISISFILYLKLVITNKTIIDLRRFEMYQHNENQINEYDIRYSINLSFIVKENWFQVMGTNPWLWPFPMFGESGRPKGDGLTWQHIQN
ncbi:unnamed protein product (macronuclear) [Paramecium tetraurelia]|uniref:Palmitoyltransferase n=1 Tax=Paramecium tetraurelia TaxID=5888 RepID=A0ED44_PARTE|nr:uncharacterized protein GSPATT00004080001 [Paramecium tetraurelia]CAK93211.1 unnamed protein product [Paramecium tetraurelia]|eukprot:XP_001460608.1 hypothetical protein (macronuclear) [Paramecium tetraurelia strain d4-2]